MRIILNNRDEEFDKDTITVSEMLIVRKFSYKLRIIKINGELISRDEYDKAIIKEGDNVQMVYLMSGG